MAIFTGNALQLFPIRIDKKKKKEKKVKTFAIQLRSRRQFFVLVLVYILDEYILFTVFCSMFVSQDITNLGARRSDINIAWHRLNHPVLYFQSLILDVTK